MLPTTAHDLFRRTAGGLLLAVAGLAVAAPSAAPALCAQGLRQSPVDIGGPLRTVRQPLQPHYRAVPLRLVNDGHTVRAHFAGNQLGLGTVRLALTQFHFHWPGGDQLAGESFPLALHLLHRSASGQLVALVVLVREGAPHPALAELLPLLPGPGAAAAGAATPLFDPARLLPADLGHYAYDGSLTAAPCTEGVRWLVLRQPLQASAEQLARFRQLFPRNDRPVQPLHGRVIEVSP